MCKLCRRNPCLIACPNYIPPKTSHHCSVCQEGIYTGETYIENDFGEYIHEECIKSVSQLLKWLGYKIEIMEEINERDY